MGLYNDAFSAAAARFLGARSRLNLFLSNSGEKDGLSVTKFSDQGEPSSHGLHVFTQRREQEVGTLLQT